MFIKYKNSIYKLRTLYLILYDISLYDNVQYKIVVEYQEDCLIYSDLRMIYINLHTKVPLNGIGIV